MVNIEEENKQSLIEGQIGVMASTCNGDFGGVIVMWKNAYWNWWIGSGVNAWLLAS